MSGNKDLVFLEVNLINNLRIFIVINKCLLYVFRKYFIGM